MFKGIVFDMDGVLFDTECLAVEAYITAGKQLDYAITETLVLRTLGLNTENSRKVYERHFGDKFDAGQVHQTASDWMIDYVDTYGVPLKPGLHKLLDTLDTQGLPAAIATSTSRKKAAFYLHKAGLSDRFAAIITGDMITRGKPEPDIYLKACTKLNISPHTALAVEDSPAGITSAYRAGLKVVMVPDLLQPDEKTSALLFACVPSLNDIAALL